MTNKCTVGADISGGWYPPLRNYCNKTVYLVGADIIRPKKEATKGRPYEILIIIQ